MAFHFTLDTVLRYRQSLEDRELLLLQTLLVRRAALLQQGEQLRQTIRHYQDETRRELQQEPVPAVEIHFVVARLQALERHQHFLRQGLGKLENDIAEQRSRLLQQRRNREVLDALRDTQWRDYRLRQQRQEQARLDELHLLRLPAAGVSKPLAIQRN